MIVKAKKGLDISGQIMINEGSCYEAKEDGNFIMIRMEDDSTVKAPKDEVWNYFEKCDER